jgi:hypothetical protein
MVGLYRDLIVKTFYFFFYFILTRGDNAKLNGGGCRMKRADLRGDYATTLT